VTYVQIILHSATRTNNESRRWVGSLYSVFKYSSNTEKC